MSNKLVERNDFVIYEKDNNIKIEVYLENENIWMTQEQISNLYDKAKSTINEHIKNILEEKDYLEIMNIELREIDKVN